MVNEAFIAGHRAPLFLSNQLSNNDFPQWHGFR